MPDLEKTAARAPQKPDFRQIVKTWASDELSVSMINRDAQLSNHINTAVEHLIDRLELATKGS